MGRKLKKCTFLLKSIMLLIFVLFNLLNPASKAASLILTVTSSKQQYNIGDQVGLVGNLTQDGTLVTDALISLEIRDPKNELFMIRAFTTGQSSQAKQAVEITNIITCDSNGNPKSTFNRGDAMGFKISFKNNMLTQYHVIITVNMFYCNAAPFKAFIAYNGSIDAGQEITFTIWPIMLPSNALAGTAVAYACIFNKMPSEGGLAYSPERNATFNIIYPSKIKETIIIDSGKFNITYPLTTGPIIVGNYTAYAKTYYNYYLAFSTCTYNVQLKSDVNNDGKVDAKDIAIVCKAFGTKPGDTRWNPVADLNGDGKVDAKDIAIVCKAFGITVIIDP